MTAALAADTLVLQRWTHSARRIAPLAWPVLVGQLSVLAFATVDTLLVARTSTSDLAALAVGGAAYITVFIGFMGMVMALAPIVAQLVGAGKVQEAGEQVHQALWLAAVLAVVGSTLLLFPAPFLALSQASPEVAGKVRGYLAALAFSLPASLLFTVFRAFNTAVSRPKAVMGIQIGGLVLKVPLSLALVGGLPTLGIPALGVVGCGIATCMAMWAQTLAAVVLLRRDPFYAPFCLPSLPGFPSLVGQRGQRPRLHLNRPDRQALRQQLALGLPMGGSILIEVTGFAFMAIFIARLGTTPVAGHQIAANLVTMLFMVPLALSNATSTLVAQHIGAGDAQGARRLGRHGLAIACSVAAAMGMLVFVARAPVLRLYTHNAAVIAAALPLVAFVAAFHVADAAQTMAAFVLRAYKVATAPMLIYVAALWGVGLGGGYCLAFNVSGAVPQALQGAPGFWFASTTGLALAGAALSAFVAWMFKQQRQAARAAVHGLSTSAVRPTTADVAS